MTTLSAARGSEPTALSFGRWSALTADQQAELIDEVSRLPERHPEVRMIGPMPIEEIKNPAHRDFALGMLEAVGELELEDDFHETVGELAIQVHLWALSGSELIAGRIDYLQAGRTADGGEVTWRATARLNHELQPIDELPYVLESSAR